ncbi:hypothetical protein PYJP_03420 [Pyrofollis japonicus]|uniref:ribbon-helix-helix domain-containing protein n=1 Tax=Pyrofollis japonicus TaxID=3060460 RepID=UPI0037CC1480|nr:hypothetical protein PYJP_03420 [Pyrofollis japonicus]
MPKTVIITFKAPAELVERLDELVYAGVFRNRSEALRHALVMLINKYGVSSLVTEEAEARQRRYGSTIQA